MHQTLAYNESILEMITHKTWSSPRIEAQYAQDPIADPIWASVIGKDSHIPFLQDLGKNCWGFGDTTPSVHHPGAILVKVHVFGTRDADRLNGGREEQGQVQLDHGDVIDDLG